MEVTKIHLENILFYSLEFAFNEASSSQLLLLCKAYRAQLLASCPPYETLNAPPGLIPFFPPLTSCLLSLFIPVKQDTQYHTIP
jgi:hypothetical protein